MSPRGRYIPALRFHWLTTLYDPLVERWSAAASIRKLVVNALDLHPQSRLLEVGCGSGRLAIEIKQRLPQISIHAIDADPRVIQVAEQNARQAQAQIHFGVVDITQFGDQMKFDRIYSTLVFHHLTPSDKARALEKIRAVLEPSGKFVVADFSRPQGLAQSLLFYLAQLLDGFERTNPHRNSGFEQQLAQSFRTVVTVRRLQTAFGTVGIFICEP